MIKKEYEESYITIFIFFFVCSLLYVVKAQDTEFWFVAPTPMQGAIYNPNAGFIFSNGTNSTANVKIHFFKTGRDTSFTIPAHGGRHIKLTRAEIETHLTQPRTTEGKLGLKGGVHITSDQKIIAYYFFDIFANKDMFTLKGRQALGTEFYVPQSSDGFFLNGYSRRTPTTIGYPNSRDMIDVIATENDTRLTFTVPRKCYKMGAYVPAQFYAANTPHTVTLQKGEIFRLAEVEKLDPPGTLPPPLGVLSTLGGTHLQSDKPIAVTSGEDLSNYDMMGDQVVPADNLSTLYVVVKGYSNGQITESTDRVYITAMYPNTDITVNTGGGWTSLGTGLNPGDMVAYDMGNLSSGAPFVATFKSTEPVACLHSTAEDIHPAAGIVPSLYSLGQSDFSYYQIGDKDKVHNAMMLVYRATCDTNFYIKYTDHVTNQLVDVPLIDRTTGTLHPALVGARLDGKGAVPGVSGWEYMRLTLPNRADESLVQISNPASPFSFGYYSGCVNNVANTNYHQYNSYGYISAFGRWKFETDTIWRCADDPKPQKLLGGYAEYYKWIFPDSSIHEGPNMSSVKATRSGQYVLLMNQGQGTDETRWTTDTCWIQDLTFNASVKRFPLDPKPAKIGIPQVFKAITKGMDVSQATCRWTFEGGKPETAIDASPRVVWNSTGKKKVTLNILVDKGVGADRVLCDTTLEMTVDVRSAVNGYFVNGASTGGRRDGSDWENAFPTLEEALSVASQGDYVWVAQGEYTPPKGGSFLIDYDSVHVYGGFKGTETNLNERNLSEYRTVLRGNGNSVVIFDGSTTYTNGFCGTSRDARLDGFTVLGGAALDGAGILFRGGASGTVANSIIKENVARGHGGGIYIDGAYAGCTSSDDVLIYNTEVSHNRASTGGGLYNNGSSFLSVNNTLSGNMASSGSGFYNSEGRPTLRNTIVWGNLTDGLLGSDVLNGGGSPYWRHSNVSGWDATLGRDGGNNIDRDPLFLRKGYDSDLTPRKDGDYRLNNSSPSVNRGYNPFVLSGFRTIVGLTLSQPTDGQYVSSLRNDLGGRARIYDDVVDLGAYEYHPNQGTIDLVHSVEIGRYPHVTTSPDQGLHYVKSQSTFTLILIPESGYTLEGLKVTTGSKSQDELGFMKLTHNEDGTVTVYFRHVIDPLKVKLSGVSPVSNVSSERGDEVWSSNGLLYVRTSGPKDVRIYSLTGQLLHHLEGLLDQRSLRLSQGVYIVKLGTDTVRKVVVR